MTCDDRRDAIFLYAAGALDPAESDAVRAHLSTGCPRCAGALAEADAVLASLPLVLPPVAPAAETKNRLMERIGRTATSTDAAAAPRAATGPSRPTASRRRFSLGSLVTYSGLAAAIAAAVSGVAVWQSSRGKIDQLTGERDILFAERLQLVSLAVPEGKGAASGRVYWDLDRGRWRVVVFNLKPLPAGKAYQLWAIPEGGAPIPMETFTVDAKGAATFAQSVPASTAALKVAAITAEPVGGSKAPTGAIELAGEVK